MNLFHKYRSSNYYMPGSVLGAGDTDQPNRAQVLKDTEPNNPTTPEHRGGRQQKSLDQCIWEGFPEEVPVVESHEASASGQARARHPGREQPVQRLKNERQKSRKSGFGSYRYER